MKTSAATVMTQSLLILSGIFGSVTGFAATLEFNIEHSGACVTPTLCAPVSEYRIYEATGELLGTAATTGTTELTTDYGVLVGQEYCYDITAFNGEEGEAFRACAVAGTSAPVSPTVILRFR